MSAAQIRDAADRALEDERQQAGGDEQLVGDRIQHAAERGLLAPDAREIAIEIIGDAGDDEEAERDPAPGIAAADDAEDDERHGDDAAIGQHVRQRQEKRSLRSSRLEAANLAHAIPLRAATSYRIGPSQPQAERGLFGSVCAEDWK